MKILDIRILSGPNYWSVNHCVVVARINIGKYEYIPSNRIDGLYLRMQRLMPGLFDHHCSEGKPGGFLERVKRGTWIGHIVEHIALELQTLSGMPCSFGKTRSAGKKGYYNVIFSYKEERAGVYALNAAIRIAVALAEGVEYDLVKDIEELKKISAQDGLGPSTRAIVSAALAREIPFIRLGGSLVQLGYGCRFRRIDATITDNTSTISADLAGDKEKTKIFLSDASLPVPFGKIICCRSELEEAVGAVGYPLVIKPYNSNQGKGVRVNIKDFQDAVSAFTAAAEISDRVIVEEFIPGEDYRLLVINYRLVAAAHRTPAMVTGNSFSTIRELIEMTNQSPERGLDHENILTKIKLDKQAEEMLKKQNMTPDFIPATGQRILLRQTANLSQGGTAIDVTHLIHPQIAEMAERAARTIGLDICGIDLIAEDISQPVTTGKVAIIEVNAAPGFRMHTNPFSGMPRPVGEAVIEMLFPGKSNGRIPIVAVTGTNGKTTTVRLLAHIVRQAGYNTGFTTTEGIYINDMQIEEGDCTGARSAQKILKDKIVDFAILECARGGIIKSGLGFDSCDTAIVTNVAEDHLGLNGIDTIEEMAEVKSVVPESVREGGIAILNENNEHSYRMKKRLKCPVALFSLNGKNDRIEHHCRKGGLAAVYNNRKITLINGKREVFSENVENIPLAMNGLADFMIENIMAAILAAYHNRIIVNYIIEGLRTFYPSFTSNPGRLNCIRFRNFDFLLDYAHNVHALEAFGTFLLQYYKNNYRTGIISAPGDRRESDIVGIGKVAAEIFDSIIIRIDEDTRGRKREEISGLLQQGVRLSKKNRVVHVIEKESDAILHACSVARANSVIVLLSEDIKKSHHFIDELKSREEIVPFQNAGMEVINSLPEQ